MPAVYYQWSKWLRETWRHCIAPQCRAVSTTSAINRGLRSTRDSGQRHDSRGSRRGNNLETRSRVGRGQVPGVLLRRSGRSSGVVESDVHADVDVKPVTEAEGYEGDNDGIPIRIPYTTAASEFLYGSNVVLAALRAKRRRLHHLYLHPRSLSREVAANDIRTLAKEAQIPIHNSTGLRLLDAMSAHRPHNGVALEASAIAAPPALGLGKPDMNNRTIPLNLARQTVEDIAVHGTPAALPFLAHLWRHPFVLLLDGITDPGNVGNILRTAYFYGVDTVAVASNTCANLSSGALAKASSGACEAVRLISIPTPSAFVYNSAKAGWRVCAAVAPSPSSRSATNAVEELDLLSSRDDTQHLTTASIAYNSPLSKHPCILMLGAEGEGLRANLKNRADYFVTISGGDRMRTGNPDVGVDSMNVAVAAGVLMEAFLRRPETMSLGF